MPSDLIYMWNLKHNKTKNPRLIDTENRLVVARGGGRGWAKWVKGIKGTNFQL